MHSRNIFVTDELYIKTTLSECVPVILKKPSSYVKFYIYLQNISNCINLLQLIKNNTREKNSYSIIYSFTRE